MMATTGHEVAVFTRRQFLANMLVLDGWNVWTAIERVNEVAAKRPDLDMDEERTWGQWLLSHDE